MRRNILAPWPIALYGLMLLFAGLAYFILTKALIVCDRDSSCLGLAQSCIWLLHICRRDVALARPTHRKALINAAPWFCHGCVRMGRYVFT
jgi:hypothetical protein